MTNAQQVRSKRLEKINSDIREIIDIRDISDIKVEIQKIFDWILDILDKDTEQKFFGPIEIFLWDAQDTIKTNRSRAEYDVTPILCRYNSGDLFFTLKRVIEEEEGFKAELNLNASVWDENAIMLKIVVE